MNLQLHSLSSRSGAYTHAPANTHHSHRINFILASPSNINNHSGNKNMGSISIYGNGDIRERRESWGYPGRDGLAVINHNIHNIDNSACISSRTTSMHNNKVGKKIVGKNTLKPTTKPQPTPSMQTPTFKAHHHLQIPKNNQELHTADNRHILNERMKQMRISQSIQPIVHPYRDRSTDSYHYGHGYGHGHGHGHGQQAWHNQHTTQYKEDNRPTASMDYSTNVYDNIQKQDNNVLVQADTRIKYFMQIYKHISNPNPNTNTDTNTGNRYQQMHHNIPHVQINLEDVGCIKEDIENQKDSKEIYTNVDMKKKENNGSGNNKANGNAHDTRMGNNKNIEERDRGDKDLGKSEEEHMQVRSVEKQSQLEKCKKIKYLYQPYSMNLTSNHKPKVATQPNSIPNSLYTSTPPPNSATKPQYELTTLSKLGKHKNTFTSNQCSQHAQQHEHEHEHEQEQDKWDKILRKRQQQYTRGIYAQAGNNGEVNKLTINSDQMGNRSRYSYHSSFKQKDNHDESIVEELTRWTPQHITEQQSTRYPQPQHPAKITDSYKNFSQKIQQISNSIKPNLFPSNAPAQNAMKYSYSFEQNKQPHYKTDKQLFNKFLYSQGIEWMLIYEHMQQYVEQTYASGQGQGQGEGQGEGQGQGQENGQGEGQERGGNGDKFVTFVKIGNDGEDVYGNRVLGHYIGVWLMAMGYMEADTKERVLENIDLFFTSTEQLIQGNINRYKQQSQEQEQAEQTDSSIRQISQILYNNLFYGYLPGSLQLSALLQLCRRGWQYFTFTICKIIKLLIKENNKNTDKSSKQKIQYMNINDGNCMLNFNMEIYRKLEKIISAYE